VDSGIEAVDDMGVCVEAFAEGGVPPTGVGVKAEQERGRTKIKTQNAKRKMEKAGR
jgi:hypothetical protein